MEDVQVQGPAEPFWYWKLDNKEDWKEKRDENIKFYERRRNELN